MRIEEQLSPALRALGSCERRNDFETLGTTGNAANGFVQARPDPRNFQLVPAVSSVIRQLPEIKYHVATGSRDSPISLTVSQLSNEPRTSLF